MNRPIGVAASVARTSAAFLKVAMPVKLTHEPIATTHRISSGVPMKQWNTPRTCDANGSIAAMVSPNDPPRVWTTTLRPTSAATSSCWRNTTACLALMRASASGVPPLALGRR